MTQTPKVLIALVILAVTGVAANQLARPGSGLGEQCRRAVGDAQRHCYSQLLSERLAHHGGADAMKTLEQLAVADPYMTEHAHEYAHGIGIESFTRYPDIVSTFVACGGGSACRGRLGSPPAGQGGAGRAGAGAGRTRSPSRPRPACERTVRPAWPMCSPASRPRSSSPPRARRRRLGCLWRA